MTDAERATPGRQLDRETLLPYLDLHLVGATNGVRLFEAARTSWAGTQYEDEFSHLHSKIDDERAFLERLIRSFGHRPSVIKMTFARIMSGVARLDPLNPLRRRKTGGAQLELEALQSLLKGKEALWSTLLALLPATTSTPGGAVLDRDELEDLLATSKRQQETVGRVMTETAAARFLHS